MPEYEWQIRRPKLLNEYIDRIDRRIQDIGGTTLMMLKEKGESYGLRDPFSDIHQETLVRLREKLEGK